MTPHVYLFTDGSCGPSEIGGWGAVVVSREGSQRLSGAISPSTVSRCELYPVLEGLRYIRTTMFSRREVPTGLRVMLVSDSEYVVKVLSGLYEASRNEDLWAAIRTLCTGLDLRTMHRPRNSHPLMQLADSLAYSAYEEFGKHVLRVGKVLDEDSPPGFELIEQHPLEGDE